MTDGVHSLRKKVCIVTAVPLTLRAFMKKHIEALKENYDVTLVSSGSAAEVAELLGPSVSFISVPIARKISISRDLIAFFRLWRLFGTQSFDSVHSITPKAGLLSMIAARLQGIPCRIHTFTGQMWLVHRGLYGATLKFLDKLLAGSASRLLTDSPSQRLILIENQIVAESEIEVLAEGSISGVNIERFKFDAAVRLQLRQTHQITTEDVVFLFLGRLNRDKGLLDLSRAFSSAAAQDSHIHLFIVGPDEEGLDAEFSRLAEQFKGRVHRVGFTDQPEQYMTASDVFCLPSYREGFGTVLIEAASVGVPAIASRIYGITDAVEDGVTGILHTPQSEREIAKAMLLLASDSKLRSRMGEAAKKRVKEKFTDVHVSAALTKFYRKMFSETLGR